MVGSLIYAVPIGGKRVVLLSQARPQLYPVPGQQSKVVRSVGADCRVHTQLCPVVVEESQSLFLCLSIGVLLILPASQSYCESNELTHAKASSYYCYCCNYCRSQAPAQSRAFCTLPYVFRLSRLSSLTHPVDVRVSALVPVLSPPGICCSNCLRGQGAASELERLVVGSHTRRAPAIYLGTGHLLPHLHSK